MNKLKKLGILILCTGLIFSGTAISASENDGLPVVGVAMQGGIPKENIQYVVYFKMIDADTGEELITKLYRPYKWYNAFYMGAPPNASTTRVRMSYKLGKWEGGENGHWTQITDLIVEEMDIQEGWNFFHIPLEGQDNYGVQVYKQQTGPDPNKSGNNYLSSLQVERGTLTPEFNKENTEYNLTVDEDVEDMSIYASTEDSKAKVQEKITTPLSLGKNKITITAEAENGVKRYYHIMIIRGDENAKVNDKSNDKKVTTGSGSSTRFKTERNLSNFSRVAYVEKVIEEDKELTNTMGLTIEEILVTLSASQREQIYSMLKQRIPYTAINYKLGSDELKNATQAIFTDEQINQILESKDLLLDLLGVQLNEFVLNLSIQNTGNVNYSDVLETCEDKPAIEEAISLGILKETEEGKFNPDSSIRIEDAMQYLDDVLLLNEITAMKLGRSTVEMYYNNISISDFPHIGSIATKLMISTNKKLADKKIGDVLTKGEFAQIIYEVTDGKLKDTNDTEVEVIADKEYEEALKYCVHTGLMEEESSSINSSEIITKGEAISILMKLDKAIKKMKENPVTLIGDATTANTSSGNKKDTTNIGGKEDSETPAIDPSTIEGVSKYYMQ